MIRSPEKKVFSPIRGDGGVEGVLVQTSHCGALIQYITLLLNSLHSNLNTRTNLIISFIFEDNV